MLGKNTYVREGAMLVTKWIPGIEMSKILSKIDEIEKEKIRIES